MGAGGDDAAIELLDVRDRATAVQLLAVQHAAYRIEAGLIGFDGIPPLHETLDELIADPVTWWGVRDREGAVVAGIAVARSGPRCSIDKLIVAPSRHRHGLGRRLVRHVLAQPGLDVVEVSTGTGNAPARGLYESLGFKIVRVREIGPGVTVTQYDWWHHRFATSFDGDVANYEAARPGYPSALFDELAAAAGLRSGARVLELGPGPGPVTAELLARGASVVAVEPGAQMVRRLRERFAGRACEVVESAFEHADLDGPFDLAVAGTSLHWVDLTVGLPRLATLLPPGAWLAPFWNVHGPVDLADDPIEAFIREITAAYVPMDHQRTPYARDVDARRLDLGRTGDFELLHHERFTWPWRHDAASLRALFASFSDYSTMPEPARTEVLDEIAAVVDDRFGGEVVRSYTTELYLARRLAR